MFRVLNSNGCKKVRLFHHLKRESQVKVTINKCQRVLEPNLLMLKVKNMHQNKKNETLNS